MSNYSIISNLVEKHFSLSLKSIKRFEELLLNPLIDEEYLKYNLQDRKIYFPITDFESYDEGWKEFKIRFDSFCEENKITYDDFINNTINGKKLFKQVIKYYEGEEKLLKEIEKISLKKLPKVDKLFLVLSLDFADWFLCSTAENWTSCLDLDSDFQNAYWANLPGLVADKNRALLYLTDGSKKEYQGIRTDKIISRSWIMLDKENNKNIIKEYPLQLLNIPLTSAFISPIKEINKDFISKHPVDFIFNKRDYSVFPYLDKCQIKKIDNKYFFEASLHKGGVFGFTSAGQIYDGSPYNYENGLLNLIINDEEIDDYCGEQYACEECGIGLTEDELYYDDDGHTLCETCFYEEHDYCESCGKIIHREEAELHDGEYICKKCL